jgi:acetylornithine/succinyldiaminopimelate/putrescine aminotransferase
VRFVPWGNLAAVEEATGDQTAAIMLEPIQGEGGVRPATPEFLKGVEKIARAKGALVVFDEVQCGLGRTGKMFAHQHAGVVPDIMTLAKPLGGGLPMGAVLLRDSLVHHLHVGDHGSTFGGNPVAAAAALAVLDRLMAPGFLEGITKNGDALQRGLKKLARAHRQAIAEVRGMGLMVGVEFHGEAAPVLKGLRERGVLATKTGDKVLRLVPPLVVKRADIKTFLAALQAVLESGAGLPAA